MATVSQRERPGAGRGGKDIEASNRALGLSTGWNVFSYLIAGMAAYGGIGWLVGRAVHVSLLFPIGMVVGLAISVGYVIYRYGRAAERELDAIHGPGNKRGDDR
jgi:F0F1-type ATP synthase assembly protein I